MQNLHKLNKEINEQTDERMNKIKKTNKISSYSIPQSWDLLESVSEGFLTYSNRKKPFEWIYMF